MNTNQATTTETVKYSTQLPLELIKWAKLYALSNDIKDYAVIRAALEDFRAKTEQEAPKTAPLFDVTA